MTPMLSHEQDSSLFVSFIVIKSCSGYEDDRKIKAGKKKLFSAFFLAVGFKQTSMTIADEPKLILRATFLQRSRRKYV